MKLLFLMAALMLILLACGLPTTAVTLPTPVATPTPSVYAVGEWETAPVFIPQDTDPEADLAAILEKVNEIHGRGRNAIITLCLQVSPFGRLIGEDAQCRELYFRRTR